MPQIPNETRWNSQITCVESYISNHQIYLQIRGENEDVPNEIGNIIDNIGLLRDAQHLLKQLNVFGDALNKVIVIMKYE